MEKKLEKLLTTLLGILWVFDGVLQLQPNMFTSAFSNNVLKANLPGQPQFMTTIIMFGAHIFTISPILENVLFAGVQICIGIILLVPFLKPMRRYALYASILWCLIIWVFGEGLGDILTGSASLYTGIPGAVVLYLILAFSLLYEDILPLSYLPQTTGILLYIGGILNALPMFWTKGMQSMLWQMSEQDPSGVIATPAKSLSHALLSASTINIVAIFIPVLLGILLIVKPTKILGWVVCIFLFAMWWISQDFGGIFTFPFGTATDVNSAPLFMLFVLPVFFSSTSNVAWKTDIKHGQNIAVKKIDQMKWYIAILLFVLAVLGCFLLANWSIFLGSGSNMQSIMKMR